MCHVEGLRDTKCDGESCQITTTHVNGLVEGPSMRAHDGEALQQFHIKLTSYVNTIKKIRYINKQDNLNNLKKVIHRLRSSLIKRSKHWQICLSRGQSKWWRTWDEVLYHYHADLLCWRLAQMSIPGSAVKRF